MRDKTIFVFVAKIFLKKDQDFIKKYFGDEWTISVYSFFGFKEDNPDYVEIGKNQLNLGDYGFKYITDELFLNEVLASFKTEDFIFQTFYPNNKYKILKEFLSANENSLIFSTNNTPSVSNLYSYRSVFKKYNLPRWEIIGDFLKAFDSLFRKIQFNINPKYILCTSLEHVKQIKNRVNIKNSKFIYVNSSDIQQAIDIIKTNSPIKPLNQVLFLDQYLFGAIDFIRDGGHFPVDKNLYLKELSLFLEKFSNTYKVDYKIALHPKIDKTEYLPYFKRDNLVLKDSVLEIAKSRLVFGHYSTILYSAVFLNKPIVLLTSDQIEDEMVIYPIKGFQKKLNLKTINISKFEVVENSIFEDYLKVDHYSYRKFKIENVVTPANSEENSIYKF